VLGKSGGEGRNRDNFLSKKKDPASYRLEKKEEKREGGGERRERQLLMKRGRHPRFSLFLNEKI